MPPTLQVLNPALAYDGEYFYRLALDPLVVDDVGIALDIPSYRQQRILYPLLARALSAGDSAWVPSLLVALNVIGLGVVGVLGALFVRQLNGPAWWGVALPLYIGFSYSLTRDLAEILEACLVVGSVLALKRRRGAWSAALMGLAVLARETALLTAVALLVSSLLGVIGARRALDRTTLATAVAGMVSFLAVQAALWLRWGIAPALAGSGNLAVPLSGPLRYLQDVGPLGRLEAGWFVVVVAAAVFTRPVPAGLRLAVVAYVLLMLSLSPLVWAGDAAWLRAGTEAAVLSWLSLFHGPAGRVVPLLIASIAIWPLVARWAIST